MDESHVPGDQSRECLQGRGPGACHPVAKQEGYRPAYGRECGPLSGNASTAAPVGQAKTTVTAPPTSAAIKVWVNTGSGVYHCLGTRYYGRTQKGAYMEQSAAQTAGHRPAGGTGLLLNSFCSTEPFSGRP